MTSKVTAFGSKLQQGVRKEHAWKLEKTDKAVGAKGCSCLRGKKATERWAKKGAELLSCAGSVDEWKMWKGEIYVSDYFVPEYVQKKGGIG